MLCLTFIALEKMDMYALYLCPILLECEDLQHTKHLPGGLTSCACALSRFPYLRYLPALTEYHWLSQSSRLQWRAESRKASLSFAFRQKQAPAFQAKARLRSMRTLKRLNIHVEGPC